MSILTTAQIIEKRQKFKKLSILDAYRKYQAAVNYGEFVSSNEVDAYIARIYAGDSLAIDAICPQLLYFMGRTTFAQSGLVRVVNQ